MKKGTAAETKDLLKEDFDLFKFELLQINIHRITITSRFMTALFLALLLYDYFNSRAGVWQNNQSFALLWGAHLSAFVLLIASIIFHSFSHLEDNRKSRRKYSLILYGGLSIYMLQMIIITCADIYNYGSAGAYLGAVFTIAVFVITFTWPLLLMMGSWTLIITIILVKLTDFTGDLYTGQIINIIIYSSFAVILSRLLFFYQLRDFSRRRELHDKNEQLKKVARYDHLTGIMNRRFFREQSMKELERCRRYKEPLALALFDIDYFKRVNDTYGHQTGDRVLQNMTSLVGTCVRDSDLFARWGGEEFILLSLNVNGESMKKICDKLRLLIENNREESRPPITVSVGITQFRGDESLDELVNRADKALYRAKEDGRNCLKMG